MNMFYTEEDIMKKELLYCIPAGQYGKEGVLSLLAQHPEIRFVSLIGIDLAGNDTDERIPIEVFKEEYDDFFLPGKLCKRMDLLWYL